MVILKAFVCDYIYFEIREAGTFIVHDIDDLP